MARVDDEVHLQRAQQRIVKIVQRDPDGVRAVGHQRVERRQHHERDAEHVRHDVDEQLRLEYSRHGFASVPYVQVREPRTGHVESRRKRRADCVRYPDVQHAQHPRRLKNRRHPPGPETAVLAKRVANIEGKKYVAEPPEITDLLENYNFIKTPPFTAAFALRVSPTSLVYYYRWR